MILKDLLNGIENQLMHLKAIIGGIMALLKKCLKNKPIGFKRGRLKRK